MMKKISKITIVVLSILIGLYPIIYLFIDRNFGLLSSKSTSVLNLFSWNVSFYTHIIFGGISLCIGWLQFNKKFILERKKTHRKIGIIYTISVFMSSISGFFIALYATGGMVSQSGFLLLSVFWFVTTIWGFISIKNGNVLLHQKLMIYSYAACFAAVTLRLWLPILFGGLLVSKTEMFYYIKN